MKSNQRSQSSHTRGLALVAVLWLIAILAIASVTTLRVISFDIQLATAKVHGSRACHLAEMGIAIGTNALIERNDPLLHRIDETNNEEYHVSLESEGARFNINTLVLSEDKTLLRSIFIHWGLDLDTAQALTDAYTDWVDGDDEAALNGAEVKDYVKMGRMNQPFNRPFYDVEEMSLVIGMDQAAALRPDWRNWFTVFSSGTLDINEADAELIAIAAEVSPEQATIIPQTVRGTDDILDTEDDARFEDVGTALILLGIGGEISQRIAPRFTHQDDTTRISSIGRSGDSKREISVIVRNRSGRPLLLDRTESIVP